MIVHFLLPWNHFPNMHLQNFIRPKRWHHTLNSYHITQALNSIHISLCDWIPKALWKINFSETSSKSFKGDVLTNDKQFTLDAHPNTRQPFKVWYQPFFWFTAVLCSIKQSKTKIDFKRSLIHYLDHVWLLDPVSPHTNSSASPFTSAPPDRQAFLFNWVSKENLLRYKINHLMRCQVCFVFFFFAFFCLHVAFIAVQPAPGELGRFLISEIVDNSRFPSGHISVSVPCRSNLAPAERYFRWFLLSSHSRCLSV